MCNTGAVKWRHTTTSPNGVAASLQTLADVFGNVYLLSSTGLRGVNGEDGRLLWEDARCKGAVVRSSVAISGT